jgi:hypothetical protein
VIESVKPTEPSFDLDEAANEADQSITEVEPIQSAQKIFKITQFIDFLKSEHSTAKRFNIYLFSDKCQTLSNDWTDSAAAIYFKPALVVVSLPDAKPVNLTNQFFNDKFGTIDWGITFNESKTRKLDLKSVVNILKVLPEPKTFNNNPYYNSRIFKPDATEQKLASILMKHHDDFSVFVKTYVAHTELSSAEQEAIECCDDILDICV